MLVLEERVSADDMPTLKMVEDHSVRDVEEGLVGAFATPDPGSADQPRAGIVVMSATRIFAVGDMKILTTCGAGLNRGTRIRCWAWV